MAYSLQLCRALRILGGHCLPLRGAHQRLQGTQMVNILLLVLGLLGSYWVLGIRFLFWMTGIGGWRIFMAGKNLKMLPKLAQSTRASQIADSGSSAYYLHLGNIDSTIDPLFFLSENLRRVCGPPAVCCATPAVYLIRGLFAVCCLLGCMGDHQSDHPFPFLFCFSVRFWTSSTQK